MISIALGIYLGLYNLAYCYRKCHDKNWSLDRYDTALYAFLSIIFIVNVFMGR